MEIHIVILSEKAEKDLIKVPLHIATKFQTWVDLVETDGLMESRKIKSYHDEPLKGARKGQRSIRLNKAYRAIYIEKNNGTIDFIEDHEVNKHDY